jgi:uncharacterized damage-inducible protein DinB
MSVFSNRAGTAVEGAAQYTEAVLGLLGDADPINILESTAVWCEERTADLSSDQVTLPESTEKWNVVAVLQHLADSELVWGNRLRTILAEDRPQIIGMDQDLWADRLGYRHADRDEAISLFSTLRRSNLRLLNRTSPGDLDRVGVHNERGEVSVRHMIRMCAGHDLLHRRQIERIIDAVG